MKDENTYLTNKRKQMENNTNLTTFPNKRKEVLLRDGKIIQIRKNSYSKNRDPFKNLFRHWNAKMVGP